MSNTNTDQARTKAARMALCHIAALDVRKKTRQWGAEGEAALAQAEGVIAAMPGRLLLQAIRAMKAGGPQSVDPLGVPTRVSNEKSQRPTRGDGTYEDASMRPRLG